MRYIVRVSFVCMPECAASYSQRKQTTVNILEILNKLNTIHIKLCQQS